MKTFKQSILLLSSELGIRQAFSMFLDLAIHMNTDNATSLTIREASFKFPKSLRKDFFNAYFSLQMEITGDGSGCVDVLGNFYQQFIEFDKNILPQQCYDTLPGIVDCSDRVTRFVDYSCKSGRKLLAMAQYDRSIRLYGVESNPMLSQIALLNLCLNNLTGEIFCWDYPDGLLAASWSICLNYHGKPVLRRLSEEYCLLYKKRQVLKPNKANVQFNF